MAIVAHTPYTGNGDCERTNEYLCDGHGLAPERTNRYISDGHGGHTLCEGYNCPSDPVLATEYMETLRLNYERQHPPGEARAKGSVTHEQIYVSPTEEDNVPAEERMQMMRELIERTTLKDFASIYVPHDNTPDKHGHISCCPYSVDGTHKLCLNNAALNDLRREMDRICVEHGYSIVENPELWSDKEYRDWFFQVKEEGIVTVHPPKEQDMTSYRQDRKRARTYSASKQAQEERKVAQQEEYKRLTTGYNEKSAHLFHTSAYLYNPSSPNNALHIRRHDKGREMGEMEQAAASIFVWAAQCEREMERRKIKGSAGMQRRLAEQRNKAFSAMLLVRDLDIRTQAELVGHTKECGQDIAELKQDIARQSTIIDKMADIMDAIDRWENCADVDAYAYLKSHRCGTQEEIADAKKRYSRAISRKASDEALLQERSKEYRHLKEAAAVIDPASSEDVWHDYLEQMFTKEIAKKVGYVDDEALAKQLYAMGEIAGLTQDDVDNYIAQARATAKKTTWVEYRMFMRVTFTRDSSAVTAVYDEIRENYQYIRDLRHLSRNMPVIGPFTLLLALAVAVWAGYEEAVTRREIEELKWKADLIKELERRDRMRKQEDLKTLKTLYALEVMNASAEQIDAAKVRFYQKAAELTDRLDVLIVIECMQQDNCLNSKIADAVSRRLDAPPLEVDLEKWERG